jgi:hypothetical protein
MKQIKTMSIILIIAGCFCGAASVSLPEINRNSSVYRHADRILVAGMPDQWRLKTELVRCFGAENVFFVSDIDDVANPDCDALILYSGINSRQQLNLLAEARQVVVHLPLYADFQRDIRIMSAKQKGTCRIVDDSYFTRGFKKDDKFELSWVNQAVFLNKTHPKPVVMADKGALIVEDGFSSGSIIAMDLDMLSGRDWDFPGYQDLVLQWLLEALGCENVDMGFYQGRWQDYGQFMTGVRKLAMNSNVSLRKMPYTGQGGYDLYMTTVSAGADKPVIFVQTGIHPIEPGGCYGVLGYLNWLLKKYQSGDIWARTVLDNLEIQWVPVLCAGSFDKYFKDPSKMPPFGNTNGDNVNLNRNFEPLELWQTSRHPHKGEAPFSARELKNIQWAVERSLGRIKVFADYHNCSMHYRGTDTCFGAFAHTVKGCIYDEYCRRTNLAFNHRYFYRDFCDYDLKDEYTSITFDSRPHVEESKPMSQVYGASKGIPLSVLIEIWGIRDITPYQQIGQFDAAAAALEQMIAFELGAAFYNHTSRSREYECGFAFLDPSESLDMYVIDRNNNIRYHKMIIAADKIKVTLNHSERLIVLKSRYAISGI